MALRVRLGAAAALASLVLLLRGERPALLRRLEDDDDRPDHIPKDADHDPDLYRTIHTFYEPIDPRTRGPPRTREALELSRSELGTLDAWRYAWEIRGWKTRVLTLKDAERHPGYGDYEAGLASVPLGRDSYLNRLCYLRWLAMAAKGGGWMSDVDVVPIAPPPSSKEDVRALGGGKFTSYGGYVPSLMWGSASEWDRMARLLLDTARSHGAYMFASYGGARGEGDRALFSDKMGLLQARLPAGVRYESREEVLQGSEEVANIAGRAVHRSAGYSSEECDGLRGGYRAVHFSYAAVDRATGAGGWDGSGGGGGGGGGGGEGGGGGGGGGGPVPGGDVRSRADMMRAWAEMFDRYCSDGTGADPKREGGGDRPSGAETEVRR